MIEGTYVALPTPFDHGKVDYQALKRLISFVIDGGVEGILACGTTGEAPTLTEEEWVKVVETAVEQANGKVKVMVGTGTNSTQKAVAKTKLAAKIGADSALVVCPYYNKPTQEGLYVHFMQVASQVDIDVVLYNIPSRTGVNMKPETVARLAEIQNIVAIKEASGSVEQVSAILKLRPEFRVLSGDDSLTLPMMALGAVGVVSTAANVAPKEVSEMCRAMMEGNYSKARGLHYRLWPIFKALFIETNPAPVKYALSVMGIMSDEVRLPLVEVSESTREAIKRALSDARLL